MPSSIGDFERANCSFITTPKPTASMSNLRPDRARRRARSSDGRNVDLDAAGSVLGFDIDHASKRFNLFTLETEALPGRSAKLARSANRA